MLHKKVLAIFAALAVAATMSVPALAARGGHGDHERGGGSGKGALLKTRLKLKIDPRHWDSGATVAGTVLLQVKAKGRGKFAPLAGATLTVFVDGTEAGTLTTDADGKANPTWTATADGEHKMRVVYAGDETHKGSRGQQPFHVGATADEDDDEDDEVEATPTPEPTPETTPTP